MPWYIEMKSTIECSVHVTLLKVPVVSGASSFIGDRHGMFVVQYSTYITYLTLIEAQMKVAGRRLEAMQ